MKPQSIGFIDGYNLQRKLGSQDDSQFSLIASLPSTGITGSYKDTGLSLGTAYSYRISAFNEVGESPYSEIWTVGASSVPGPSNAPTVAITTRGLTITWIAPNDNGSAIIQYFLVRKIYGTADATQTSIYRGPGTVLSYLDRLSVDGKTYVYRVFATNAKGAGPYSAWSDPISWHA